MPPVPSTVCRTRSTSRRSPLGRHRSRPPPRARSTSPSPATRRRFSERRPTPRSRWSRPTTVAEVRRPAPGARRLTDPVGDGAARQEYRRRQRQFRARAQLAQLDRAGLTPSDVKLVFLQPADALTAFTQRRVDVWAVGTPTPPKPKRTSTCGASPAPPVSPTAQASAWRPRRARRSQAQYGAERFVQRTPRHPLGPRQSRLVGQALRRGGRSRPEVAKLSQGRSLRLPTALSDGLVASEQELADLFAESKQIARRPNSPAGSTGATTTC